MDNNEKINMPIRIDGFLCKKYKILKNGFSRITNEKKNLLNTNVLSSKDKTTVNTNISQSLANEGKRIIFHYPLPLNPEAASASGIRPFKMIEAFKSLGYHVDLVTGYSRERKIQIKKIKKNINNGMIVPQKARKYKQI